MHPDTICTVNHSSVKYFALCLCFLYPFLHISAQDVRIVDALTGEPVANAMVITGSKVMASDESGSIDLEFAGNDEPVTFLHPGYLSFTSTRVGIRLNGNVVKLTEDPVWIDEIIISASRWEQAGREVPYRIKQIEAVEIGRYQAQSTADLLGASGAAFIQKSQMGGGSPMLRGFAANRVLLVVDGIRMNNAIFRSGNLHNIISVDVESIGRAELVYGPASVMYGSDALGGVMSFYTINPELSANDEILRTGKAKARWSGANKEKAAHAHFGIGTKRLAFTGGLSYSDFGNLKMGSRGPEDYLRYEYAVPGSMPSEDRIVQNPDPEIQIPTAYHQLHLNGKMLYRASGSVDFTLGAYHSHTSDVPRYDRLVLYRKNMLRDAMWNYGPQKWSLFHFKADARHQTVFFDKARFLAGFQNYTESRHERGFNEEMKLQRQEDLQAYSVNLDFSKAEGDKNEFFYGAELFVNTLGSTGIAESIITRATEEIPSRYPDGSFYGSASGYLSWKYRVNDKIVWQTGGRYTYTGLKCSIDTAFYQFPFKDFRNSHTALSGNTGLVWHTGTTGRFNLNFSTGFRSPNIDDLAKVFESAPGNVIVPNPELKPEYAVNAEAGYMYWWAGKARVEASFFFTRLFDAMVRRDFTLNGLDSVLYDGVLSKVEAIVNADAAIVAGIDMSAEVVINSFIRSRLKYSLYTGEDSEGYPLRHVPPGFGSCHLIFERDRMFTELYTDFSGKLEYNRFAPDEREKPHLYAADRNGNPWSPSWWTLNVRTQYKLPHEVVANFGIDNILDKRYKPYSSGVAAPGRNIFIAFSRRF